MATSSPEERRDALAGRIFEAALARLEVFPIHIGDQLGLYQALSEAKSATADELSQRTRTAERYVRERLEQQAVAGFLNVDDSTKGAQ